MQTYILRRLTFSIPALLLKSLLVFGLGLDSRCRDAAVLGGKLNGRTRGPTAEYEELGQRI